MTSVVLRTAASVLHPVLVLFSVFLLVRGHDEPGGGFSAALVAAAAYIFYGAAHDLVESRRLLRVSPLLLLTTGLTVALAAALLPVLVGRPILTALWWEETLLVWGPLELGTPFGFDIGVYLTVLGATLTTFFTLMED